uniref:Cyclotide hyen-D n=1 Tax=Pigea enneasperma TaxID=212266 RepID=CYHED_PIGEN|nr:RecName: Full=Cyclotide hyen-D [Pigea enneasperma]7RIH_B Chain B, Cyclotide hyen-D [Pigea enneasperma]7RN3_A Chain A, Cyclotide hyen-D [Pigea enneasperma]
GFPCGESCVYIPCFTAAIGCSCKSKVCYKN